MKTKPTSRALTGKSHQQEHSSIGPYSRKRSDTPKVESKRGRKNSCKYSQACALLQAIKSNERRQLNDRCLAHISCYIARAWEEECCQQKVKQIFCIIKKLLVAARMDTTLPFDAALQQFCQKPLTNTTICPSTTLLVAMKYIERLNKRYRDVKGSPGCCYRMIIVAFNIALKYIHDCLRLVIYTDSRQQPSEKATVALITPPTSPIKITSQNNSLPINVADIVNTTETTASEATTKAETDASSQAQVINPSSASLIETERALKIACLEKEFLYFLNYDLSIDDPSSLVTWAHSFDDSPGTLTCNKADYTSADEADDELEEEEEEEDS